MNLKNRQPKPYRAKSAVVFSALLAALASLPVAGNDELSPMELFGRLQDADPEIRLATVLELKERGPRAATAVFPLIDALEDAEPIIRIEAARALGAIGPAASPAVPALVKRFEDNAAVSYEGPVWFAASNALGRIGAASVPHLLPILESEDWTRFVPACQALHEVGPAARPAIPFLLTTLKKRDHERLTRHASIYALGGIGGAGDGVVPAIVAYVSHANFHTQYYACRALGEIGHAAQSATPELIQAAKTGVASVRKHAAKALGGIRPSDKEVVTLLVALLDDGAYVVRAEAALSLGQLGPQANSAIPDLERAAQDRQRRIRVEAARSIWALDRNAELILPVLVDELQRVDNSVHAAQLLSEMGAAAEPAIAALEAAANSADPATREAAVTALEQVEAATGA